MQILPPPPHSTPFKRVFEGKERGEGRKSLYRLVLKQFKYKNVDQLRYVPLARYTTEVIWLRLYLRHANFPDENKKNSM